MPVRLADSLSSSLSSFKMERRTPFVKLAKFSSLLSKLSVKFLSILSLISHSVPRLQSAADHDELRKNEGSAAAEDGGGKEKASSEDRRRNAEGPYLNVVYTIFGILDPLPPLSAFWPGSKY